MIKILALFTSACAMFLSPWQSSEAQKVDQPLAKQLLSRTAARGTRRQRTSPTSIRELKIDRPSWLVSLVAPALLWVLRYNTQN